MHQIVFDSVDARLPNDSGKFHKYSIQYLLPNRKDNMRLVSLNQFRIIRSVPRCPYRGSFSSTFHWIDRRRCSASDHFGEDDFRSDSSDHERARVWLLCTSEYNNPWILKSNVPLFFTMDCSVHAWSISSLSLWTSSMFCWSGAARLLKITGDPFLLTGLVGLVGSCCCLLLLQNFNLFAIELWEWSSVQDVATLKFWYFGLLLSSWITPFQCRSAEECHGAWSHSTLFWIILIPVFEHDKNRLNTLHLDLFSTLVCKQHVWALSGPVLPARTNSCSWDLRLWRIPFADLYHNFCFRMLK